MNATYEWVMRYIGLDITIAIILLPILILLLRKLTHLLKLLGFYPRARRRPPWAPIDQRAEDARVRLAELADSCEVRLPLHNKSVDYLHWQIYMGLQTLRRRLSRASAGIIGLVPASQWLFDNYNLFYKELMKLQTAGNLKKYHRFPAVSTPEGKGYPRIYLLAREFVSCCSCRMSNEVILGLLDAYQERQPLLARELWSLPEMLALCLLEKVVDESKQALRVIQTKQLADRAADRLAPLIGSGGDMGLAVRSVCSQDGLRDRAFVSHLYYRLKAMSVSENDMTAWLAAALHEEAAEYARIFQNLLDEEAEYESDAEAVIRSLVLSLKVIADVNWDEELQQVSRLDCLLAADPAGVFSQMDGQTRGLYRRTVERLAHRCRSEEGDVAGQVLEWAQNPPPGLDLPVPDHVGSYLTGRGLLWARARLCGGKVPARRLASCGKRCQTALYWTGVSLLTLTVTAAGILAGRPLARGGVLILLGFELFFISGSISLHLIQDIAARLIRPQPQLALDFQEGIPDECRTLVVMPVILQTPEQALSYIDRLEKHYLANRQGNLFFALLADFQDAPSETLPSDDELIDRATQAMHRLNSTYPGISSRFYLMFRSRLWNPSENCWMGWERKRGKLEELNALLMGDTQTSYQVPVGDQVLLSSFRYVITLDADTELIRESAASLVGIMAHPLNQPRIDEKTLKVIDGYVIVQPEIRNRIPGPSASVFARFFAGQTGIDPYATVASDVYQDVFNEGTFIGKGIYDIAAIYRLLRGTIPENSVLSHDLLEGSLSRCAFASGVKLMDTQPSGIISYIRREHRWIRGDWQLLPWLKRPSSLNWLSRWKIIDNLRRSLTQPAALALILTCALGLPSTPWLWLPYVCFDAAYSVLVMIIRIIIQKNRNPSMRLAIAALVRQIVARFLQLLLEITLIPGRAFLAADAIIRTLYRLLISHRRLLEWQTAESVDRSVLKTLRFHLKIMWPAALPALPLLLGALRQPNSVQAILLALVAALWFLSPMLAWQASIQLRRPPPGRLQREQVRRLRILARRTWNYFEDFSTSENHWLCPDNHQIYPGPKTSDKTSPTNIGLQLLSTMAARDLGFIGLLDLTEKCEKVLTVVEKLPKWHGHLYNWYQVNPLRILDPQYVSTVDSGNFVAHLIALKHGILELTDQPACPAAVITGLNDTLAAAGLTNIAFDERLPDLAEWSESLHNLLDNLDKQPTDEKWKKRIRRLGEALLADSVLAGSEGAWSSQQSIRQMADAGHNRAAALLRRLEELAASIDRLVRAADFRALYDRRHQLFLIGFHVDSQTPDAGRYDLMASEARLSSFLAVAKGDVPQKHWFMLGRPFTLIRGTPALLSWSGSMFEYLMPNLVMKTPPGSIFSQSSRAAVIRQIAQGRQMKLPWGISESQYYAFDVNANYQYSGFGVMRLRLQSTLRPAMVVAPYATLLALMVKPFQALRNIDRLHRLHVSGEYGFFEALDYNRPDSANLRDFSLVQSVMVHHQGMGLVAIDNFLHSNVMQVRFHAEPMIQAAEILLEETVPAGLVAVSRRWYTISVNMADSGEEAVESRYVQAAGPPEPVVHVLANRQSMVMLTSDGEGFASCDGIMLNRWRPDLLSNGYGSFIYLRDTASGRLWSAAWRPTCREPESYQVVFSPDKAEFNRRDGEIQTRTSITLLPADNLELRRVVLTNSGDQPVIIELTSYLEAVADEYRAESAHPAFNKLFIETTYDQTRQMLVARRRPRSPEDRRHFVLHRIVAETPFSQDVQYETDRRLFIGRNGSLSEPQVMFTSLPLSCRAGFTPEPILSLRAAVEIPAGHSASVVFLTGYAQSLDEIEQLNLNYEKFHGSDEVFEKALTGSRLRMKYLAVKPAQLNAIQSLAGSLFYPGQACRGPAEAIRRNQKGQSGLWRFGISGDNPIMLLRVDSLKSAPLINDVLTAFEVLRVHHVPVDLVIFNDEAAGYIMELNQMIQQLTSRLRVFSGDQAGAGIFIVNRFNMNQEEDDLLMTVARLVITPETGIYFRNLKTRPQIAETQPAGPTGQLPIRLEASPEVLRLPPVQSFPEPEQALEFFNSLGGFAQGGREYVIRIRNAMKPPAPWINVIANEQFGFLVSETGAGYTWAGNSRENKLTAWSNDPVLDPVAEAVFIRDETTGAVTSPCLLSGGGSGHYQVRHGFGYTVFEHEELGLRMQMTVFAAVNKPVKLWLLSVTNLEGSPRRISATCYVEWVLGVQRDQTAPFIVTGFDRENDCLTADNVYNDQYRGHQAFLFSSEPIASCTGDRRSFLGINHSARFPQGLSQPRLNGEAGACFDPCGAIQVDSVLEPGVSCQLVFGLGQTASRDAAAALIRRLRTPAGATAELDAVHDFWDSQLGSFKIHTPDRSLDILFNGWLRYQILSCRIQGRAAFYQCGGAIGFRDQLQDVLAFLDSHPERVRAQILLCCSRQFRAGDVQHWWHPPTGIGVRTRISDDLLWLPYVTAEYIEVTGDMSILSEQVSWLEGEALQDHQHEAMFTPQPSATVDTVYRHCLQAIERASRFGDNGLPLMGGGDWNDGMNRVGGEGRGESVWLGWFLYSVLHHFIKICQLHGDAAAARHMASLAANLTGNLESAAWDGQWYLRAFFDNGHPMGSQDNAECQIDSISQSWAVLSGAASPRHAARAIESARRHLVKDEHRVILLLTPPFDRSEDNPGYIRGYFPGVRENGGQYTHAAVWLAMASARLKQASEAWRLLSLLNPVGSTGDLRKVYRYEKEPYVLAGDISMAEPYCGRGGWSWYTGSASWLYQAVLHDFLGVCLRKGHLVIDPCVPAEWRAYHVEYRYGNSLYQLAFQNKSGPGIFVQSITVDGSPIEGNSFALKDDSRIHHVEIRLSDKKG